MWQKSVEKLKKSIKEKEEWAKKEKKKKKSCSKALHGLLILQN